jgi:hypothetical protein
MNTSTSPQSAKPTTAIFIRAKISLINETQVISCPTCAKATVPVPDPQRSTTVSHCYRCGTEYDVGQCSVCGGAILIGPEGGADVSPFRCLECGG